MSDDHLRMITGRQHSWQLDSEYRHSCSVLCKDSTWGPGEQIGSMEGYRWHRMRFQIWSVIIHTISCMWYWLHTQFLACWSSCLPNYGIYMWLFFVHMQILSLIFTCSHLKRWGHTAVCSRVYSSVGWVKAVPKSYPTLPVWKEYVFWLWKKLLGKIFSVIKSQFFKSLVFLGSFVFQKEYVRCCIEVKQIVHIVLVMFCTIQCG